MTFIWPNMLWLLTLVPVLVGLYLLSLRRRKTAVRYSSLQVLRRAARGGVKIKRHLPAGLMLAAIALMLFAVSRPATTVLLPSQRGTVILAMDVSGSMRAQDVEPNRLRAAQAAAVEFVNQQPRNVHIGVVAFAGSAALVQAPTLDRSDVLASIDRFQTQFGTAVGSGVLASLAAVFEETEIGERIAEIEEEAGGDRRGNRSFFGGGIADIGELDVEPVEPGSYQSAAVILLTDGQATHGPNPEQTAQLAADLGVRVYTVGLGTREGTILRFMGRAMRVRLDEETLQTIADRTRGEYFRAENQAELNEIYGTLGSRFITEEEETEVTALVTALAALFGMLGAGLSILWFGRPV
jgi:Ca-activated chloride channel family protein